MRGASLAYEFMEKLDIPKWYRGLAKYQHTNADKLLNAMRDDILQNTTHRVRDILRLVGISPNITHQQASTLLKYSRGNDLAFLWFAWELIYKTDGINFSINEQLLLSMIVHLDMVATLRELDRILPPPQPTKREIRHKKLKDLSKQKRVQCKQRHKDCKTSFPYFQSPNLPCKYGKRLTIDIPDMKANFSLYKLYKDPNYIASNETNRWFENYNFQPSRRIAKGIIQDQLNTIFDDSTSFVKEIDGQQQSCEHHKILKELQLSLENELKVIAKQECVNNLQVEQLDKEKTQKRIQIQLQRDVENYSKKFREEANKSLKLLNRFPSASNDYIKVRKITSKGELKIVNEKQSSECCASNSDVAVTVIPGEINETDAVGDWNAGFKTGNKKIFPCDCKGDGDGVNTNKPLGDGDKSKKPKNDLFYFFDGDEDIENLKVTHLNEFCNNESEVESDKCLMPKPSEMYFHAPTENKPFLFDYEKIFKCFDNESDDIDMTKFDVKKSITKNLYIENGLTYEKPEHKIHPNEELDLAIDACAKKIWNDMLKERNKLIEKEMEERENKPKYFDPNDVPLMLTLLKESFKELKQNPKFVLASLPDAHKCPLFLTWILDRFGKVYTHKERLKIYNNSAQLFLAIDHILDKIPKPRSGMFSKADMKNTNMCSDYLNKRYNNFVKNYFRRMHEVLLEQTRIGWFAMKPLLCSGGRPDSQYFSYMPSSAKNLIHFRMWQPHEHKNNYMAWLQRNRKLKAL